MKTYSIIVFTFSYLFLHCYSLIPAFQIHGPTIDLVQNFEENEDSLLNFTQLTWKYGYKSEEHRLVTADQYILTLFRIPKGRKCINEIKRTPILMMHGIFDTSDTYIIAGPDVGLAYILADACYDVWCGNVRGNCYSRNHVTLKPDYDKEFWNYSYHEHGIYDLSATVDYVLDKTGANNINYIGHSQGSTVFFVLNAILPEYKRKFNIALLLAPVAWLSHVTSPLLQVAAHNYKALFPPIEKLGIHEILPRNGKTSMFLELVSQFFPKTIGGSAITVVLGTIPENISSETISTLYGHYPAGTSIKNLKHFSQGVQYNVFQQFNYGSEKNIQFYYQEDPPEYDLTNITVPVVTFSGVSDTISRPEDVEKLLSRLPNVVDSVTLPDDSWTHINFVVGDRIPEVLAPKVFQYLDLYN